MRVGIVGAGALGSVIGGLLFEAGVEVVLIRRNTEHVNLIRERGLWLEGVSGDRLLRPAIAADPGEAGEVDLALVLVKSYDTKGAVPAVERILSSRGTVLTLQNGIGNYEILAEAFPGRVLLGTTTMGALGLGPGKVRHTGFGHTHFGEADGRSSARAAAVGSILEKIGGGPVHLVDNAVGCVWSKLIINAAINAPATLLRVRNGDLTATESGNKLIHDIVDECVTLTRAKEITLIFEDPEAQVKAVCEGTASNLNSMFQDVLAGRRTEIDFINGAVAGEAESAGTDAPVNKTLALLIKSLEQTADRRVPDQI